MAISISDDGTIKIYQGDTGEITVNGLFEPEYATEEVETGTDDEGNPIYETVTTDTITNAKNFKVYFEVQDSKRNIIFEKVTTNNGKPSVTFKLTATDTDLLTVPTNKNYVVFYYGIKACDTSAIDEDTLFVGGKSYGQLNQIIVYPKQAEGTTKQTEVTE